MEKTVDKDLYGLFIKNIREMHLPFIKTHSCKIHTTLIPYKGDYEIYVKWGDYGSIKILSKIKHSYIYKNDQYKIMDEISNVLKNTSTLTIDTAPSDEILYDLFLEYVKKHRDFISNYKLDGKWVEITIVVNNITSIVLKISNTYNKLKDLYIFNVDDDREIFYKNILSSDTGYIRWPKELLYESIKNYHTDEHNSGI